MTTNAQPQPDFWTRLGRTIARLLGFLLRLLFVLLLAGGLGAGVYYGIPWVYRAVIAPVQNSSVQVALQAEQLDNLRTNVEQSQSAQDERLTDLETGVDARRERLAAAEATVADLEAALADERSARAALDEQVAALTAENETQAEEVAALQEGLADLEPIVAAAVQELAALQEQHETEVDLLRLRSDLLQARLQLVYENLGEARRLLRAAGDDLLAFVNGSAALPAEERAALTNRLLAAQELIEDQPAIALAEMESAWAQLDRFVRPNEP